MKTSIIIDNTTFVQIVAETKESIMVFSSGVYQPVEYVLQSAIDTHHWLRNLMGGPYEAIALQKEHTGKSLIIRDQKDPYLPYNSSATLLYAHSFGLGTREIKGVALVIDNKYLENK